MKVVSGRGRRSLRLVVAPAVMALTLAGILPVLGGAAQAATPAARGRGAPIPTIDKHPKREVDDHTVLVRFRAGADRTSVLRQLGATVGEAVGATGYVVVRSETRSAASLLADLRGDPAVDSVALNGIRRAAAVAAVPNDTLYGANQATYMNLMHMPTGWDLAKGSTSFKVAVLDTGVDLDHPDLAGRINPGYDFVNNDSSAQDDDTIYSHGSLVAGIAAAVTNNSRGVAGAAWTAGIIPVKVLNSDEWGTDAQISSGITWAADHGAQVINLSLVGYYDDPALKAAVDYALGQGVVVVAAAGDDAAGEADPAYPAAYPGVLAVSAADNSPGNFVWWSNHGSYIGVAAPSFKIWGTWNDSGESYGWGYGTSFATPLVSAIALLVRFENPTFTPAEVVARIEKNAADDGPKGIDPFYGWGRVDGYGALKPLKATGTTWTPDTHEPNGTLDSATAMGASISGTIVPEGDVDWFKATVATPGSVTFTVTPPAFQDDPPRAKELDPILEVYGPDSSFLGRVDDHGPGDVETITVPAATAGAYAVAVSNFVGSQGPSAYTVTASFGPPLSAPVYSGRDVFYVASDSETRNPLMADFTGDGLPDIARPYGNFGFLKVDLFPGQANGFLGPTQTVATPEDDDLPSLTGAGDVTGDGGTDLTVAVSGGFYLYPQSAGGLGAPTFYPSSSFYLGALAVGDLTGDGKADVVPWYLDQPLVLWESTGSGFVQRQVAGSTTGYHWLQVSDATGDGRNDIIAGTRPGSFGDWSIQVFRAKAGHFVPATYTVEPSTAEMWGMEVADVNGDGLSDVVVSMNTGSGGQIQVWRQAANGKLKAPVITTVPSSIARFWLQDANGDGRTDLFTYAAGGFFGLMLQGTDGRFGPAIVYPLTFGTAVTGLSVGDLDLDGRPDVAAFDQLQSSSTQEVLTTRYQPSGTAWVRATSPADFATAVPRTVSPTVTFARDLDPSSITSATVFMRNGVGGNLSPVTLTYDAGTRTITLDPTTPTISGGTPYVVYVTGLKDLDGREIPGLFSFRFTTGST